MALVVYTKPGCPYCRAAKDFYNENRIAFIEYDAQNDKMRQKEMLQFTGGDPTVPTIVENGILKQVGWGDPPRG